MKATMREKLTRREFCGLAAATGVFSLIGGSVSVTAAEGKELLRPPGGQDAAAMGARCLHCDRCRSICPTGAVMPASWEDGALWAESPKLDFRYGSCDFCGLCQEVCPTGALGPFDPLVDKLGMAVVHPDRCLAYFQGCVVCVEACPFDALACDENGHPVVNETACNGCGVCENCCPSLVYRSFAGGTQRGISVVPWNAANECAAVDTGEGDSSEAPVAQAVLPPAVTAAGGGGAR